MSEWIINRERDDPVALRISVGCPMQGVFNASEIKKAGYLVYRGDPEDCLILLREALAKLEQHVKELDNE